MGPVVRVIRRLHDRSKVWFRVTEPVTYREAWRYSTLYGFILGGSTITYYAMGSSIWPIFLALIVPTMATFTFGVAVRGGSFRQRLLSIGVGALGASPLLVPTVRTQIVAIGAPGLLLVWFLVLIGLLGYAFPEIV